MKKIIASVLTALFLVTGFTVQPALAACGMTGSGTSGDPWIILTAANLSKVGVIAAGECATTQNQDQHYKLGADIALTGNFTPINLAPTGAGSFDGNSKTISGLQVSTSTYAGLFSGLTRVTVRDLKITGTSVVSSGSLSGSLSATANNSTFSNITVQLTGDVGSASTQQNGGLIGDVTDCTLSDMSFVSTAGAVKGTSYIGGAFGHVTGSTLSNISVSSDVSAANISGGIAGSYTPDANASMSSLYYSGTLVGDQYVGGLIGYLWSYSNFSASITNSAVMGTVATETATYSPAAFVGHVGNGISPTTISKSYTSAEFLKDTTVTPVSVTTVAAIDGNGSKVVSDSLYESWGAGANIPAVSEVSDGILDELSELPVSWAAVQQNDSIEVAGSSDWVIDGSSGPLNSGRPMPTQSYNRGFFANLQCAAGRLSSTGNIPCRPAEVGRYVALPGQTAAVDCPAGTYQSLAGQMACLQAPAGYFVANTGSYQASPCASGYTSLQGAISCTIVVSSGGGSSVVIAKPLLSSSPKLIGVVAPGKAITVDAGTWTSTTPIQYSYTWYRCSHPVAAAANLAAESDCVAVDKATQAALSVEDADTKKFITALVTASNLGGSATFVASSVNAKSLKYLALAAPAKLSGTAKVGQTLSVYSLKWIAAAPTKTSYRWYRCDSARLTGETVGAGCKAIVGANKRTYKQSRADKSKYITVKVTSVLGSSKVATVAGLAKKSS